MDFLFWFDFHMLLRARTILEKVTIYIYMFILLTKQLSVPTNNCISKLYIMGVGVKRGLKYW
jgi:hypothetical protein